jgi:hypothetical protein
MKMYRIDRQSSFRVQCFFPWSAVVLPSGCSVSSLGVQPISLEVQPANAALYSNFPRSAAVRDQRSLRYGVHAPGGWHRWIDRVEDQP